MVELLPFIIAGLTSGAIYGLAGIGLVLTYKTSGIFNFAQGSLATISAFVFYTLTQHGVPWAWAALIAVAGIGPVLGLVLERLSRVLSASDFTTQVAGTIGIVLIVEAGVTLIYGSSTTRVVGQFLPSGGVTIDGTRVSVANIIIFVIGITITVCLYGYLRTARLGLAMRAVVDDPALLNLAGTSPVRVRRAAWIIGSTLAALSGVLLAPLLPAIDGTTLTLLIITAFGAAAIGGFTSLPGTLGGGLIVGIAEALASKYFGSAGPLSGVSDAVPFIALFVVLMVSPKRRLGRPVRSVVQRLGTWSAPPLAQLGLALAVLVFLAFVPTFAGIYLVGWMTFLTNVILFLSLGLLVRTSGQVSLCQVGFAAIGVTTFSHLALDHHLPWLIALLLSGLIVVPIGAVLAIPAIRLNGLYLALATLGFGLVLSDLFYGQPYMFGDVTASVSVPRPDISWLDVNSDRGYFYLVLGFATLVSLVIVVLNRTRLGRLLRALASSPTGLAASGTAVNVTRLLVFCLSAFLAAIAGVLNGATSGVVSATSYSSLLSVTFFAVVVISVGREPWYAIFAAAGYTLIPLVWSSGNATNWLTLLFGVFAVLTVFISGRDTRPRPITDVIDRLFRWRPRATVAERAAVNSAASAEMTSALPGRDEPEPVEQLAGLEVDCIVVRFGGLVAVNAVTLAAPIGRITGLIGPNGAGKSTTLNACSGLVRPSAGRVRFDGRSISRRGSSARARMGMGRTFQQMQLFDELSVLSNVSLGREGGLAGSNPLSHILPAWGDRARVARAAASAMQLCGLDAIAGRAVGTLPTGQRRLVELARCLAGPYQILLLDEPSSGLDRQETERFGALLQQVVQERHIGILLIEHDMTLVSSICDFVYVLDFGEGIFSGTPQEVLAAPVVQQAYLGIEIPGHGPAAASIGGL